MRVVIITGMSGSGKSVALNVLEDLGYYCVDNLPPALLASLVQTLQDEGVKHLAVAVDVRSAGNSSSLEQLPQTIATLRTMAHDLKILFLSANTHTLVARFSETRRSHPLSHRHPQSGQHTLIECIAQERDLLAPIETLAHVLDTSELSSNKLRAWVKELVAIEPSSLILSFESFAFKHGVPMDADFVFDVRALPNPFYDLQLRPLSGRDAPVAEYLAAQPPVTEMLGDIRGFIEKWLPTFKKDNRSYLTVAIGCTGGQHRSVYIAEQLSAHFHTLETVVLRHRELPLP